VSVLLKEVGKHPVDERGVVLEFWIAVRFIVMCVFFFVVERGKLLEKRRSACD